MLAFLVKYYYNIIIYCGQKGCIDMCNCENEEKGSVLPVIIMIISAVSFILGIAAGITLTKKICKHKNKQSSNSDFDADEYVRSLNLDE